MSPFCHDMLFDHSGGVCEDETEDQCGVPERLGSTVSHWDLCGYYRGECIRYGRHAPASMGCSFTYPTTYEAGQRMRHN